MYDEDDDDGFNESELLGSLEFPSSSISKSKSRVEKSEELGPSREELLKKNSVLEGEVEQLQLLIGDLSRRLQNAHHTISSFKRNASTAVRDAEGLRGRYDSFHDYTTLSSYVG